MNTKIKTIIFDCFGVICDPVLYKWYEKNSSEYGFSDEDLPNVLRKFDLGILNEDDIVNYFTQYKGIKSTKEEIFQEIDSYLRVDQELVAVIRKLKDKGYRIILLSNGHHFFFERKIYKAYPDFEKLFDKIIISSQVNMVKPDAEIYLHTLEKATSHPEESIFIDDSKPNVDAAIKLGMHGHVYTDSASFVKHLEALGILLK